MDFLRESIRVRASYASDVLTLPKSGKGRAVPMVAATLARLSQRGHSVGEDELVFSGELVGYLDGSALRRCFVEAQRRAGLPPPRFHDVRHTFGTLAARSAASLIELKEWMGHADVRTTQRYTHYREHADAARRGAATGAGVCRRRSRGR